MTETSGRIDKARLRRFCPYPAYRDSGVEWLGEIPVHWEVGRADRRLDILKHPVDPREIRGQDVLHYSIPNVQQLGIGGVEPAATIDSSKTAIDRPLLLVSKLNPRKGTIALARPHQTLATIASSEFIAMEPRDCILEFARYFYLSVHVRLELSARVESATRSHQRCSPEDISKLPVYWPSISEQTAIAAFLDRETVKIDRLVERKERLIELLQEKRAALITRAVTRGLDPNAPMKDSSVEWLGEIPAHWEVRRIAMAVNKITNGYVGPTRDILVDDGVPYLQSLHIKNGQIKFDRKHYFVTKYWSKQHRKSILREGDVLVVQTGDIGQNCVVSGAFEGANCHALIILRLKPHLGEGAFLSLLLQSTCGQNALKWSQTGALHPHLECGHVREIRLVLPPPHEQRLIMRAVEEQLEALDSLQAKVRQAINHLKEFRTALISAAVTGKIDVREEAT